MIDRDREDRLQTIIAELHAEAARFQLSGHEGYAQDILGLAAHLETAWAPFMPKAAARERLARLRRRTRKWQRSPLTLVPGGAP